MPRLIDQLCPQDRAIVQEHGTPLPYGDRSAWVTLCADAEHVSFTPRGRLLYSASLQEHGLNPMVLARVRTWDEMLFSIEIPIGEARAAAFEAEPYVVLLSKLYGDLGLFPKNWSCEELKQIVQGQAKWWLYDEVYLHRLFLCGPPAGRYFQAIQLSEAGVELLELLCWLAGFPRSRVARLKTWSEFEELRQFLCADAPREHNVVRFSEGQK